MRAPATLIQGTTPSQDHVRLDSDLLVYKDCAIPVENVKEYVKTLLKHKKMHKIIARKWYWPTKNAPRLQLLLLLLASAYPLPYSLSSLKSFFKQYGLKYKDLHKTLHDYYRRYGIVEHVSWGNYKLADWYFELLEIVKPYWRELYFCMIKKLESGNIDELVRCENAIVAIISFYIKNFIRSEKVGNCRQRVRRVDSLPTISDSSRRLLKTKESNNCHIEPEKISEILRSNRPALYEELSHDIDLAGELIAVLYARAKRGKPYLEVPIGNQSVALATIQDEARALVGSSSSLWRVLDFGEIAQVLGALSTAGLVFLRKYGRMYKIRIDKQFEALLDREVGCYE